nr:MAG TPA: hypothetical protein [Caudoviricetes sp.]
MARRPPSVTRTRSPPPATRRAVGGEGVRIP